MAGIPHSGQRESIVALEVSADLPRGGLPGSPLRLDWQAQLPQPPPRSRHLQSRDPQLKGRLNKSKAALEGIEAACPAANFHGRRCVLDWQAQLPQPPAHPCHLQELTIYSKLAQTSRMEPSKYPGQKQKYLGMEAWYPSTHCT